MNALADLHDEKLLVLALAFARIAGLLVAAPVIGSRIVPVRMRLLLALVIAMMIAPVHWDAVTEPPSGSLHLLVLVARETVVGLALGLGISVFLSGLHLTGQLVSQLSGMSLADVIDPTWGAQVPVFTRLLDSITLAVFLVIGGHRQVMHGLLQTFHWLPPGQASGAKGAIHAISEIMAQSFVLGIRAGAPMIVALLISVLAVGVISRTFPQFNMLGVGFALNSALLLVTMFLSLGGIVWVLHEQLEPAIETILGVFGHV